MPALEDRLTGKGGGQMRFSVPVPPKKTILRAVVRQSIFVRSLCCNRNLLFY